MQPQANQVTLSPKELCEYRRVALECATQLACQSVKSSALEPAVVMHNAGCLLMFMLHGLPVQPAEVICETKFPEQAHQEFDVQPGQPIAAVRTVKLPENGNHVFPVGSDEC